MYEYQEAPGRRFATGYGEVELRLYDRDCGTVYFGGGTSHFVVNGVPLRGDVKVGLIADGWVTGARDVRRMYGTKTSPDDDYASESQKDKTAAAIAAVIRVWGETPDETLLARARRIRCNNRLSIIEDNLAHHEEILLVPYRRIQELVDEVNALEGELEVTSPLRLGPRCAALYDAPPPEPEA